MAELKTRLRTDLTAAIKARDELRAATLRMALAAVTTAEVAGASARELTDDEVLTVLGKEAKKRKEAAQAYDGAGRGELAARERAELGVLEGYLPAELDEAELETIIDEVLAGLGTSGPAAMGPAMKEVRARVGGRADGAHVAAMVRQRLGMG
jgi:uncharacterized protein